MTPLHGIASRDDLPLPFGLIVVAAAIVLVATFWVLLLAWREPRYRDRRGQPLPRLTRMVDSRWFSRGLRLAAGLVWLLATLALVFGAHRIDNPVFGFIFVWLWVGLVPAALLLGQVYRRTNPVRLLLRMSGATAPAKEGAVGSVLPAAGALVVFSFLELVEPEATTLPAIRGFAALWLAWVVIGTLLTSQAWIARADPFEAFATTMARFSPWARTPSGQLSFGNPLRNLAASVPPRHSAVLLAVLLGGTLFDAVSASAWWVRLWQGSPVDPRVPGLLGLLLVIGIVFGAFVASVSPLRRAGRGLLATADALSPGLVPLVAGYFLAHYGTMLYLEGQRTAIRFGDPLGRGWNLFGIAEAAPDTTLLAFPMVIAVAQVLCIVGGHVAGVLVTHDIVLRDSPPPSAARQLPLLLLMVTLTVGGMLLMFGE